LRTIPIVKLLIVFAVAFSLASLTGPMSGNFHLPTINPGHALPQVCNVTTGSSCSEYWVPAGPAEDTLQATIFTDEQAEFTNIQSASPSIDLTDWPLTPDLTGPFTTSSNFRITSTISAAGNFEIQFLLANNFWGVNMNFGNDPNGVQIRQGIAHMVDTAKFAANEPSLSGQAVALDTPNPSDNVGSLPTANPCAWDTSFPQSGANCIVGAPGGTAYHLGTAAGANGITWLQAPGSADLNAAAQHFVNAGIATGFNSATSVLTGISSAALSHVPNFYIRNDNTPRLHLGDSYAAEICYLFTGAYTVPCAYLSVTHGPITAFPGFTTSTTSVNLSWGMYTAAYGSVTGPLPFDSTYYFTYNSHFASVIPSIASPTGPCDNTGVPTVSAADYIYLCNSQYDSLTNQMEFSPCLTVTGDPTPGSTSNISTGHCSGTTNTLSAIGAGVQAADQFGKNAYTIEVFQQNEQFGYLNNGWIRVDNNVGSGIPNFWTWLNAWNPSPALSGTIRQGFKQSTSSVSPFIDSTVWDAYIVGSIYDSLTVANPLSGGQLVDWMALSVQQLSNPSLTYTPPGGACTAPNTPVGCTASTFRFTLRSDMFFQDGRKVTSFDVAFSYLALKATGAFAGGGAAPMTGITILGPSQFDINVNAVGPFTLLTVSGLPVLPGAYWTSAGSSAWGTGISACTATGATCYPAQYTLTGTGTPVPACAFSCTNFPASLMNVNLSQTTAGYDPIANHTLVGSSGYTCGVVTSAGSSTSCSSTGAMNPPVGGSYVLSRFGKGLAPASSVSGIYFRSNGNLAAYIWSQDTGDITHDFLNFSVVASCFGAAVTSTGPCAHFQRGIGANGGPVSVGLSQVAIVNRFVGLNWVAPFNWVSSPPVGIIPLPPVLYENTITLNPASVAGCTTAYPTGGYDC
jgi:hypothetical protein